MGARLERLVDAVGVGGGDDDDARVGEAHPCRPNCGGALIGSGRGRDHHRVGSPRVLGRELIGGCGLDQDYLSVLGQHGGRTPSDIPVAGNDRDGGRAFVDRHNGLQRTHRSHA